VSSAVALDNETHVAKLVERALLEADRERPQRLAHLLGGERGQDRGIDAAGEQHANRDVADEMRANRVAQACPQLLDELGLLLVAELAARCRAREALQPRLAAVPDEQMSGQELPALPEDCQRRRDRVEREEGLERVEIDLAAGQRAQLRRELESAPGRAVVERFDPEAIAREHEPAALRVPDRDGEHSAQALRETRPVLLVQVRQHLRVAL